MTTDAEAKRLAERVERYRKALMKAHSHDWDMETISEAAHVCAHAEEVNHFAESGSVEGTIP